MVKDYEIQMSIHVKCMHGFHVAYVSSEGKSLFHPVLHTSISNNDKRAGFVPRFFFKLRPTTVYIQKSSFITKPMEQYTCTFSVQWLSHT